jgi:fucose permease
LLIFGSSAFLLFGGVLVLVGSVQAQLAAALDVGLRDTGLLGATVVLGIGAGIFAAGPAIDRQPGRPLFVGAASLAGASLLLVAPDMTMNRALGHLFFVGFGAGFYETVLNTTVVSHHGDRAVRRIALMHSAATVGAMGMPLAIAIWFAEGGDFTGPFRLLGAAHLALALWGGGTSALASAPLPHAEARHDTAQGSLRGVLSRPSIAALLVASFFYVGAETSVSLFAVPFAIGSLGLSDERGQAAISAFWLGLLVMRLAVAVAPRPAGSGMIVVGGAVAGTILGGAVAYSLPWIELVLGLAGFAVGALFPLFIALAGQLAPEARGTSVAVVAGIGSAGGFVLPWLLGAWGDAEGAGAAFAGIGLCYIIVCISGAALSRFAQRRPQYGISGDPREGQQPSPGVTR